MTDQSFVSLMDSSENDDVCHSDQQSEVCRVSENRSTFDRSFLRKRNFDIDIRCAAIALSSRIL